MRFFCTNTSIGCKWFYSPPLSLFLSPISPPLLSLGLPHSSSYSSPLSSLLTAGIGGGRHGRRRRRAAASSALLPPQAPNAPPRVAGSSSGGKLGCEFRRAAANPRTDLVPSHPLPARVWRTAAPSGGGGLGCTAAIPSTDLVAAVVPSMDPVGATLPQRIWQRWPSPPPPPPADPAAAALATMMTSMASGWRQTGWQRI